MLKIALAQIPVIPGRPAKNAETIRKYIHTAREAGTDLIVFPEMAVSGYLLGDTWEQPAFLEDCEIYGKEIIADTQDIAVMFGNVAIDPAKKNNDGRVRKYNALFTAQNGALIAPETFPYPFLIKTLLPNYREFDDSRYFFSLPKLAQELGKKPADLISPLKLKIRDKTYTIGVLLCEDGWSDDYTLSPLQILSAKNRLDFVVNLSASPYTLGKNEKRHCVFGRQAAAIHTPILYINNVGIQNNGKTVYTFDGDSTVYDRRGLIRAAAKAYQETLLSVTLEALEEMPEISPPKKTEAENIFPALAYGLRHFLSAIKMKRVVIGLSGGIDSAVAAALYCHVLGPKNILLINMPSRFTSTTTQELAVQLAKNLDCRYAVFPIQESVDFTIRQIETIPLCDLSNETAEHLTVSSYMAENIQARDRSSRILAAAAAAFGGGFSCNANKAETTVGYSTLYGDHAGFLAALADLWKYQIYDLARYLNQAVYCREVIPQAVIDLPPSAELSAAQSIEKGQGDPLRYPYHDFLFRAFIERWEKATPQDILEWYAAGTLEKELGCAPDLVCQYFPTAADFIADLERWWELFTGLAVAKRIQSPPILAVSRRAYGFDHREAQNGSYYTKKYRALKARLLLGQKSHP